MRRTPTRRTRTVIVTLGLGLLLGSYAQAQTPSNVLEGTWELVSQKTVYADTTIDLTKTLGRQIKLLNATHFAFGRQTLDGEDVYAGGGRYTLEGDSLYTEHIEYHSSAPLVGQSITFQCRVEGERWYHTGRVTNFRLEEVWQRVK